MNKYFRCNGLTKEQAIQETRDLKGLYGIEQVVYSLERHYDESDIIVYTDSTIAHCAYDTCTDNMQEVPALKPLTVEEVSKLVKQVDGDFELDTSGKLYVNDSYFNYETIEQILQIMRRVEK